MILDRFEAEKDWILKNESLYTSPEHAKAVIGNIEKSYRLRDLESKIKQFDSTRNTRDMFELIDSVN